MTRYPAREVPPLPLPPDAFQAVPTVEELAAQQGVQPIADPAQLRGDFWPANESLERFLHWLEELRRSGRSSPWC